MSAITQAVLSRLAKKSPFAATIFDTAHLDIGSDSDLSDETKLILLNEVMDQVQATPPTQADDISTQPTGFSSRRTPEVSARTVSQTAEVLPTGLAEVEKTGEIPPEISEYLSRVEDHTQTLPQEIVVEGEKMKLTTHQAPVTPVFVLPITPDDEVKAKGKNQTFSIAWLVEWSHKIIKMFLGKVIYKPAEPMISKSPA